MQDTITQEQQEAAAQAARDKITCLRPGILVSLKTSITGNRSYSTQEIEGQHITNEGEERSRWETTRIVTDPEEYTSAAQARGKARSMVSAVCSQSAFGLLCPESREAELRQAVRDARKVANEFNDKATLSRVSVNVVFGRVAQDDVEAVRAISGEMQDLMQAMENGIQSSDVNAVRNAAYKLKSVSQMLSEGAREQAEQAIAVARAAASKIVKAGEEAAIEIDTVAVQKIATARMTFLDIDDAMITGEVAAPAVDAARAIEFDVTPVNTEQEMSNAV